MPTVFLSHNSKDKPFVRKLAKRLGQQDVSVWLDEAQINIGDSLIKKISEAISQMDYVIAVLSKNSVKSNWVQKELNLAMSKEINEDRIVVLPIVIDNCELPDYLKDKLYGDFTNSEYFEESFKKILRAIGVTNINFTMETKSIVENIKRDGYEIETSNVGLELARIYVIQGKLVEAENIVLDYIFRFPENIKYMNELAKIYHLGGKFAEAIEVLQKCLELHPHDIFSYLELAKVYQQSRKYVEAENILLRVIEINPENLKARSELAKVYKAQHKFGEAEQILLEILTIDPDHF